MQAMDRQEADKAEAKNSLEEYVYDTREKLETSLKEFVTEQVGEMWIVCVGGGGGERERFCMLCMCVFTKSLSMFLNTNPHTTEVCAYECCADTHTVKLQYTHTGIHKYALSIYTQNCLAKCYQEGYIHTYVHTCICSCVAIGQ